ncbi:MAG: GTPase Der [Planctomycetota bacterium]|nr:MAG: GTPase Der [Planctomycetota bacterium]
MPIPIVAIVGRPNVGKSTLFNLLVGRRLAIVEPTPGVTRDRLSAEVTLGERRLELVDTGGIGIVDEAGLAGHIETQIELAMHAADALLFVLDARDGLTPLDRQIAARLRALGKPIVVVANKVDSPKQELAVGEFHALGLGEPVRTSARHGEGRSALAERLLQLLPPQPAASPAGPEREALRVAIVGKRNVGKSTFVNALCAEQRVIVSEIPGTTRDAIDVRLERDGEVVIAIDTAGMRRRRSVEHAIELFSQMRTEEAIRRADVVLLMLDVSQPISEVDKRLARQIVAHHKPCVVVGNKWDLAAERIRTEQFDAYLRRRLPGLAFAPAAFTCAREGTGVWEVLALARELRQQARVRVGTGELNRAIGEAVAAVRPSTGRRPRPGLRRVRPRIYFAAQTAVEPPTIVLMVNKPELFGERYLRYLGNRLRERFGFAEVPIRFVLRERLTQYVGRERALRRHRQRAGRAGAAGAEREQAPPAAGAEGEGAGGG